MMPVAAEGTDDTDEMRTQKTQKTRKSPMKPWPGWMRDAQAHPSRPRLIRDFCDFRVFCVLHFICAFCVVCGTALAQEQTPNRRDITIVAHESRFEPNRIEVAQNDLVRITLKSGKLPRSFAVDAYRISKRVAAGESITFEFHANQPGTFTFYCNLTSVAACREMKGTLVVHPK